MQDIAIVTIKNCFSPYFIYFWLFKNAVWALTSGGFRIVSDTLVNFISDVKIIKLLSYIVMVPFSMT